MINNEFNEGININDNIRISKIYLFKAIVKEQWETQVTVHLH